MKRQPDLPNLLCDLYEYDIRLKKAFDEKVRRKAAVIIRRWTKRRDVQHLDRLAADGKFSWETLRFGWRRRGSGPLHFSDRPDLETLVFHAISQAEELVRKKYAKTTPHEKSCAWRLAIRWVPDKVGLTASRVERDLPIYCHGLANERRIIRAEAAKRRDEEPWVHALAKKRPHDEQVAALAGGIERINTSENVDELLTILWDEWREEAERIPLPKPIVRSSNGKGNGNTGNKRRGRPAKSKPDKLDELVQTIIRNGDAEQGHIPVKSLMEKYNDRVPAGTASEKLRSRIRREFERVARNAAVEK